MRKPKTARIEALWLEATQRFFWTVDEIAAWSGLSKRRIQAGLKRARDEPVDIKTVWEIEWRHNPNAFVAEHQCAWHGGTSGEIPDEYPEGCLYCMKAGLKAMIMRHGKPVQVIEKKDPPKFQPRIKAPKKTG